MGGFNFYNPYQQENPRSDYGSPPIDLSPQYDFDYSYGLGDDDRQEYGTGGTGVPSFWSSAEIDTPALDRYTELIQHAPQISDYRPNFWRTLASGAIGGLTGHPESISGMMYAPYTAALQDYKVQEEGARQAANIEQSNIRSGTGFYSALGRNAQATRANQLRKQQIDNQYEIAIRNAKTREEVERINAWYKQQQVSQGQTRLQQGERRLGYEGERVQQGWRGVEQRERGLGLQERNTVAGERRTDWQTDPNRPRGTQRQPTPRQLVDIENNAMNEVLLENMQTHPEFEDLVKRDERTQRVIGWNPEEAQRSRNAQALAELRRLVQERIKGAPQSTPNNFVERLPLLNFDTFSQPDPNAITDEDEDYNYWENDY